MLFPILNRQEELHVFLHASFLWFVLVNFGGETAVQNERCSTHRVEVRDREHHRNGIKDIFLRSQHQEP